MNPIDFLQPDFVFENSAGSLKQLVHDGWKQVNIITSVGGSVRGGHYHKYNKEAFYIITGSFKLIVWLRDQKEEYQIKAGDFFLINENVFHTFEYSEDTWLISMYSNGVEMDENTKDIWSE